MALFLIIILTLFGLAVGIPKQAGTRRRYKQMHTTDPLSNLALQTSAPAALDGYEIYNTTWVAAVRPGGETVELNGTIQQVHAQLLELNPNYNADFNIEMERTHQGWSMFCTNAGCTPPTAAETTTRLLQDDSVLTFRGFVRTKCLNHDSLARMTAIDEGVRYLRDLDQRIKPKNGPGPNNCGRVSCSWAAGIYWCNDVRSVFAPCHNSVHDQKKSPMLIYGTPPRS